jgi:hypothetical protein
MSSKLKKMTRGKNNFEVGRDYNNRQKDVRSERSEVRRQMKFS